MDKQKPDIWSKIRGVSGIILAIVGFALVIDFTAGPLFVILGIIFFISCVSMFILSGFYNDKYIWVAIAGMLIFGWLFFQKEEQILAQKTQLKEVPEHSTGKK